MKFEKYHGLGNDFIIYNMKDVYGKNLSELAKKSCHRNMGIGADGMIVYEKNADGIIVMNFYNADGSIAPMCGNGIRCFTHYLKNNNLFEGDIVEIQTGAGLLKVTIELESYQNDANFEKRKEKEEFLVRVNMGKPRFQLSSIPMDEKLVDKIEGEDSFIEKNIIIDGEEIKISSLFMGTTHTVVFVEDLSKVDVAKLGRKIEKSEIFPIGTNVNFSQILSKEKILVKTWERGAGETLACGTGACGVAVIANLLGETETEKKIEIEVPGGTLYIEVREDVFMTGPSEKIAEGEYLL